MHIALLVTPTPQIFAAIARYNSNRGNLRSPRPGMRSRLHNITQESQETTHTISLRHAPPRPNVHSTPARRCHRHVAQASGPNSRYTFAVQTMPLQPSDGVPTPSKICFVTGNEKKLQEVGARLPPARTPSASALTRP
jgi:hypothetical protein